jgi:hypothetical protein
MVQSHMRWGEGRDNEYYFFDCSNKNNAGNAATIEQAKKSGEVLVILRNQNPNGVQKMPLPTNQTMHSSLLPIS